MKMPTLIVPLGDVENFPILHGWNVSLADSKRITS